MRNFFSILLLCVVLPAYSQIPIGVVDDMYGGLSAGKDRYCVKRYINVAKGNLINVNHWLVPNDSCISLTVIPGYTHADEDVWQPMAFSVELPLSVTGAMVVDSRAANYLFFVDSTGYMMVRPSNTNSVLPNDSVVLLNMSDFHVQSMAIDVELDLFRYKNGYNKDTYCTTIGCANLVFYNIPKDDVVRILKSFKILNCMRRIYDD